MAKSFQIDATLIENVQIQSEYYRMLLSAPEIAAAAAPGQFIHVQIPDMAHLVLRRPFSISDADPEKGTLTIVYKVVGAGTKQMKKMLPETKVNILGPRGKGFTEFSGVRRGVLVGGGYGCAAIFLAARHASVAPLILLGGRSSQDIIMVDAFKALGCEVWLSTDDGSIGVKGRVTLLLERALAELAPKQIAACGPVPMLKAVARLCEGRELCDCEVSMDSVMCCGMGACFACVIKRRADNPQGWSYVRACQEGPVFKSTEIYWE